MWKKPLTVTNPQLIITQRCSSHQLYFSILNSISLLGFYGQQLYFTLQIIIAA